MVYYTQKSIKCVKDLNVRLEIVKLLELSRGEMLDDIGFSKDFLVMNTIGNFFKVKVHMRDYIRLKCSWTNGFL